MSITVSRWTIERWLLIATFAVSAIAFVFGLGVNWARLTDHEVLIKGLRTDMLPRELYAADQRRLTESIDRLSRALERMEDQQRDVVPSRRVSPSPSLPPGRMFDR